ncbi:MAG: chloride channel protein [Bacteroidales bacterium]|nr:chloride channel protein [Bacteroidales bacterium]
MRRTFLRPVFTNYTLQVLFLAAGVGVLSGFIAIGFRYLLFFIQNVFFYQNLSVLEVSPIHHGLDDYVFIVPAAGGLIVGLITYFIANEAKGHGVPEVMEAVAVKGGKMRPRTVIFKALASAVSIGSGGSIGREGPIVQIGSAFGSTIAQWLQLDQYKIKVLLGCGAAGGIAATFNTPIAGIIFALEIILLELKSRSFMALVISSFFATSISRLFLGTTPAFPVPSYEFVSLYETILYLVLGVLAGFTGLLLIRSLYKTEDLFDKIPIPDYLKPALGGLLVGLIGMHLPQVFGVGYDTIEKMLNQDMLLQTTLLLLIFKFLAFILTIGSGASGGIFSPSLFIGAALGATFGWVANYAFPGITAPAGAYALVGMAAVFAASSRATFTAIIIIFELTLDYKIILPLMFACVIADLITWSLSQDTIYTKKLSKRGIFISHDMETNKLEAKRVREIFHRQQGFLKTLSIEKLQNQLLKSNVYSACVVDENDTLVGVVTVKNVERTLEAGGQVGDIVNEDIEEGYPDEPLSEALYKMSKNNLEMLPVVSRTTRKLLGYVTRADILHAFKSEIARA